MSELSTGSLQERRDIHYSGRVQGVGFRYTTRRIASRFAVTGFVRNLFDGRVHLVVEGTAGEIDHFLSELRAEMDRYVEGEHEVPGEATGEFADFSVRH